MRISALLGTRDEAELLGPAVAALLRAGADTVSIMDDGSVDATAAVLDGLQRDPRIFRLPGLRDVAAEAGGDAGGDTEAPLDRLLAFDGPLLGPVLRRDAPDWVLLCDSDEFLLTRAGLRALVAAHPGRDVLEIARHNALPGPGGLAAADLGCDGALRRLPLAAGQETLDRARLDRDPDARWILHRLVPKLMVRVAAAAGFARSAHGVRPREGRTLRRAPARGAVMVHAPFTDLARFERKIANVAEFLDRHGGLPPDWGWHWRYWLERARAGGLAAEFDRQCLDPAALGRLRAAGGVTTAAALLADPPAPGP